MTDRDDLADIVIPRVTLEDLLTRFDPGKHRHDLLLDDSPAGRETI